MTKTEEVATERPKSLWEWYWQKRASIKGILPHEFWEHHRAAHREMLLAMRSLVDAAITALEEEPKEPKKAEKIEIE